MKPQVNFFSAEIKKNWLGKTNQLWKMWIFLFIILIVLTIYFLAIISYNEPTPFIIEKLGILTVNYWLTGTGIGTLGFLWFIFSIRCPSCKKGVTFKLMNSVHHDEFPGVLFTIKVCPHCGYTPDDGKEAGDDK